MSHLLSRLFFETISCRRKYNMYYFSQSFVFKSRFPLKKRAEGWEEAENTRKGVRDTNVARGFVEPNFSIENGKNPSIRVEILILLVFERYSASPSITLCTHVGKNILYRVTTLAAVRAAWKIPTSIRACVLLDASIATT